MVPRRTRMGHYIRQSGGFNSFVLRPLPPDPPIELDQTLFIDCSRADQALGRLDGAATMLPNPDFFVAMYVRREAVNSSAIEGTQSTLEDVLAYEFDPRIRHLPDDVEEVINYVRAMNYGLNRLGTLPLSLRLLREIHAELMQGVRGGDKEPGEFRRSQNWIGPAGATLNQATFVPPPVSEMNEALDNLEKFLHSEDEYPALVHCAITHAQFETIHPFLDGNGRVGRLLIAFMLVHRGVLGRPLLYLSHFLKLHRTEYYDRLNAVRVDGDWEGWIRFFLRGVAETAEEATSTAQNILALRDAHQRFIASQKWGPNELRLADILFQRPLINIALAQELLGVAYPTASRVIDHLISIGLLEEITGKKRDRIFRYTPYVELLNDHEDHGSGIIAQVSCSIQGDGLVR